MPRSKYRIPEGVPVAQVAGLLGVHEITIRRWIKRGVIRAFRVGPTLVRVPRSEINRLRTIMSTTEYHRGGIRYYPQIVPPSPRKA